MSWKFKKKIVSFHFCTIFSLNICTTFSFFKLLSKYWHKNLLYKNHITFWSIHHSVNRSRQTHCIMDYDVGLFHAFCRNSMSCMLLQTQPSSCVWKQLNNAVESVESLLLVPHPNAVFLPEDVILYSASENTQRNASDEPSKSGKL